MNAELDVRNYRGRGGRGERGGFRGGRGESKPVVVREDKAVRRGGPRPERIDRGGRGVRGIRRGGFRGGAVRPTRGGKPMVTKYKEAAHMGALLLQNKSYAVQRLLKDLNEIKKQEIPLLGVTASPLESNMYEWHANIKALTNNIYKGTVLHLSLIFPANYPLKPPTVTVLNPGFTHPSVVGGNICLDILDSKVAGTTKGWTSAYTVSSILSQLQNFFFDIDEEFLEEREKEKGKVNNLVRQINEFNCWSCSHKGSANPWPEFFKCEGDINQCFLTTPDIYRKNLKDEIVCYHRKTSFEEVPLGVGLNVAKAPRTGEIKGLNPIFDLVCIKAYFKERLRTSTSGEKFSHWFPLYFGVKNDKLEQFLKLSRKAISMIVHGNTKQFSPDLISKVLPKFFIGLAMKMTQDKSGNLSEVLKMMIYIYRITHLMIQAHPQVQDEIEADVFKFISDPSSRVKDKTPNLGDLLVSLIFSKTHKMKDILSFYIDEKLDREIFWILQSIPELESLINKDSIDDVRAKVCFKTALVGNHILLFFNYFIKNIIKKEISTVEETIKKIDSNFGNLPSEEIDIHLREIRKITKVDNYVDYYKQLELTPPSDHELNEKLKTAFKNSAAKGYHGADLIRYVPSKEEQIKLLFKNFPDVKELLVKDTLLPADNLMWENLVIKNYSFIEKMKHDLPSLPVTPYNVIRYYQDNFKKNLFSNEQSKFKTKSDILNHSNKYKYTFPNHEDAIFKKLNWRQVYAKLYLENYIKYFNHIADFKVLNDFLNAFASDIIHFNFVIYNANRLKSDFYYVRVVLEKLVHLKHLNYYFMEYFNIKLIKNMIKGTSNFVDSHGQLDNLSIYSDRSFTQFSNKDYNVLTIIDKLPTLKVLNFEDTVMDINHALRIRNHLYYYKTIEVLNLKNTNMNDAMAKEIADGLMKAKNLESINLANNPVVKGLSSIIYNLSFQPSLNTLDISNCASVNISETAESLYKLLKMSQSLEILIANGTPSLISNLTKDFFTSLGDNSSIKYLDLSNCGSFSTTQVVLLGNAISFNSIKAGGLSTLLLGHGFNSYSVFTNFVDSLEISESLHFSWYGTFMNNNIVKDSKEYYSKSFHCSIKHLDLSNGNYSNHVNIHDPKAKNVVNHFKIFTNKNKHLETLNLSNSTHNKHSMELLADALLEENNLRNLDLSNSNLIGDLVKAFIPGFGTDQKPNHNFHLEVLNFGKNKLGYSGIEVLSKALRFNQTVKVLNLYHNLFDVNGSRRLAEALERNKSLQYIDIGYNRLKDLGLKIITDAILSNNENNIKHLGFRCNLVKSESFISNLKKFITNKNSRLENLEISDNNVDYKSIAEIQALYQENKSHFNTDVFKVLYHLSPEKLEKCVWISTLEPTITKRSLYNDLVTADNNSVAYDGTNLGIPLNIDFKKGRKYDEKKNNTNKLFAFVEFIHPNSANKFLQITASRGFFVGGNKVRVYKAGTKPEKLILKRKKKKN